MMFKFDHFVLNVDQKYQDDCGIKERIVEAGFPYEPSWGKGTKGFKASNLWIGNEYLEMINILTPDGGGWKSEWVELYQSGHRGVVCIMLDVDNIDQVYKSLLAKKINVTKPEHLKFKWCFNLLTRVMPWQNCYLDFFEGIPLQIGFQQMNDENSREFMESYMVPNSKDNNITGIKKVVVKGCLTPKDKTLITTAFKDFIIEMNPLTLKLDHQQLLIFEENDEFDVQLVTNCMNESFNQKKIVIENLTIDNAILSKG